MTNNELLEIINLAKDYHISGKTLKRLLKLMEIDGNIEERQVLEIKMLIKTGKLKDEVILSLIEKTYEKENTSWKNIILLDKFPILKEYLNNATFSRKNWHTILDFIKILPNDRKLEDFYVKELKLLTNTLSVQELAFFHIILEKSINSPLIYKSWYLSYFLDQKKTRKNRNTVLNILKANLFDFELRKKEQETKSQKIIACFELYGEHLAEHYATVIAGIIDLDVPKLTSKLECDIYIELYTCICNIDMKNINAKNFLISLYYKIATNKKIDAEKRLEFVRNLHEINLILKDNLVNKLWEVYLSCGLEEMKILKFAFLNKGIRTNILCKNFLMQETSIEVLKLAKEVFKKNRVKQDEESLYDLTCLKTPEEKIEFLHYLNNKYPDISPEEQEIKSRKEEALLKDYNNFLNNKIGLKKLKESLESSSELDLDLRRVRKKNE